MRLGSAWHIFNEATINKPDRKLLWTCQSFNWIKFNYTAT